MSRAILSPKVIKPTKIVSPQKVSQKFDQEVLNYLKNSKFCKYKVLGTYVLNENGNKKNLIKFENLPYVFYVILKDYINSDQNKYICHQKTSNDVKSRFIKNITDNLHNDRCDLLFERENLCYVVFKDHNLYIEKEVIYTKENKDVQFSLTKSFFMPRILFREELFCEENQKLEFLCGKVQKFFSEDLIKGLNEFEIKYDENYSKYCELKEIFSNAEQTDDLLKSIFYVYVYKPYIDEISGTFDQFLLKLKK